MASQRQIRVGSFAIGAGAPVAVQTMTKTETANLSATMAQIHTVAQAGADIVRGAGPRAPAAPGRGGAEGDRPLFADPRDRRLPLQPHARAEGDRSGRALRAPQSRQHRRAGE